jgi:hypothetical protein
MGRVGLNVYPSEDFDFVDSVQLPDLILDLFCIHGQLHWLLWVWLQYTIRFPFIKATPATQMQPEDHLRALDKKVFQRTPIPAMARARDGLATRTDSRVLTVSFHNPTLVRVEHAAKRHVAQIGEEICVR